MADEDVESPAPTNRLKEIFTSRAVLFAGRCAEFILAIGALVEIRVSTGAAAIRLS